MVGSPALYVLASGVMLLGFASNPSMIETLHYALRDLAALVFEADLEFWSNEPLTPAQRIGMAVVGAALVFASGAALA